MPPSPPPRFHGIIPPIATPLAAPDQLDIPALERLIEHLILGGVHGLFVLGSTGEAPSLSPALRRSVITESIRITQGRIPVLVGITDTSLTESIALAAFAADKGAAAVVAAPPFYFPITPSDLDRYYAALAAAVPLPLFLYNMPAFTKVPVSLATAERALQNPRIIGIKDSSADMIQVHGLLQLASQRPDWSVFVGHEQLTAEAVLLGAHGGINAGANLLPAFYASLYNAAAAGDLATVRALQPKAVQIASLLYSVGPPATSLVRGVKGTLALLGICSDLMAEPLHAFSDPERAELRRRMLLCGLTPALP